MNQTERSCITPAAGKVTGHCGRRAVEILNEGTLTTDSHHPHLKLCLEFHAKKKQAPPRSVMSPAIIIK